MLNWYNSGVTVELGDIVASGVDVWDFEYPVPAATVTYNGKTAKVPFDKEAFQQKILDHYRFRQIGMETVGRWLHYFRTRIREIMPYYVQLYEFEAKWFNIDDPLESYNLTETFEQESGSTGTVTGTTTDTSESGSTGTSEREAATTSERDTSGSRSHERKFLDTPQGTVDTMDDGYLTDYTKESDTTSENHSETSSESSSETNSASTTVSGSGTSEQTSEDSGTVSHTLTRRGNIGVQPLGTEVKNIRDAFINIDLMVIDELKDLFLMVY